MSAGFHIVVCGGVVPDPLQTLEPENKGSFPCLKNEMMLPHVLDPWAAHALYEAGALASKFPETGVWLISFGPRMKLQQVMMTIAQKVSFELIAIDGFAGGFTESFEAAGLLKDVISEIPGLDRKRLLVFGGWESASRGAGVTMQVLGEMLEIRDQFQGVDELIVGENGSLRFLERLEGGRQQISVCKGPPALCGWATGNLSEPPNNPQIGMANMRKIMPGLARAKVVKPQAGGAGFEGARLPAGRRQTDVVKDLSPSGIAEDIFRWLGKE